MDKLIEDTNEIVKLFKDISEVSAERVKNQNEAMLSLGNRLVIESVEDNETEIII